MWRQCLCEQGQSQAGGEMRKEGCWFRDQKKKNEGCWIMTSKILSNRCGVRSIPKIFTLIRQRIQWQITRTWNRIKQIGGCGSGGVFRRTKAAGPSKRCNQYTDHVVQGRVGGLGGWRVYSCDKQFLNDLNTQNSALEINYQSSPPPPFQFNFVHFPFSRTASCF